MEPFNGDLGRSIVKETFEEWSASVPLFAGGYNLSGDGSVFLPVNKAGNGLALWAEVEPSREIVQQVIEGLDTQFGELLRPPRPDALDVLYRCV